MELGLSSPGDAVHPISRSSSEEVARTHAAVRSVVVGRRIIATTLAGREAYGLLGTEKSAKV